MRAYRRRLQPLSPRGFQTEVYAGASRSLSRAAGRCRLCCEPLETRQMMSVSPLVSPADDTGVVGSQGVEPIDGVGNNIADPTLGAANTEFARITAANFADGIDAPNSPDLPSARVISNVTANQDVAGVEQDENNNRAMSDWVYAWGQFIDHDIDLTAGGATPMNIPIPAGDPTFDPTAQGNLTIAFNRSQTAPGTGTSTDNPAQFVNQDTSFIDGSMIYGSDATTAADLRTFIGGQLKTSAGDLLPYNTFGLNMADNIGVPEDTLFAAGDVRANENVELTNLTTLFVREHNRQAGILAEEHPDWTDEQLYQGARQVVIGEIQSITYNEWLPALMGTNALTSYLGYDSNVDPAITDEFASAAFRLHTLIDDDVQFLDNNCNPVLPNLALDEDFFQPGIVTEPGEVAGNLKYLATDNTQEVDEQAVDGLRNALFPDAPVIDNVEVGASDLIADDIQRGRDEGDPTYNQARIAEGEAPVTSFAQITSDVQLQQELQDVYGDVDNVELFVGLMAEDHLAGSSLGQTEQAILAAQFEALRDGDRFFYENADPQDLVDQLNSTTLADIISANTNITTLQSDVFFVSPTTAPTSVSLLTASDTGVSNADGVTKLNNGGPATELQFQVTGTIAGASVSLFSDGTLIGTATASGPTTMVTTNGVTTLADGTHAITAEQILSGQSPSDDTSPLAIEVDTVAPTQTITSVTPSPRSGGVGQMTIVFSEPVYGLDLTDLGLSRNGGSNLLTGSQTISTSDNITWTLGNLNAITATAGSYALNLTLAGTPITDLAGNADQTTASSGFTVNASVVSASLFYDNSKFNHNVEGFGASDEKAIDTSKSAYLPGAGTATFANLSSYTDGINGVMVDISGEPGSLTAGDFTFRVGTNNMPSLWAVAPTPSTVAVRAGSGTSGSDRVELTWTDGSITQEWLKVTVNADANTGLATPYTFFYGSVMANSGTGDTGTLAITSSTDENGARAHNGSATVTNVFDYNKDGFVNSSDENAARGLGALIKFIKIAANTPLAPDAACVGGSPELSVAPVVMSGTAAGVSPNTGDRGLASGLASLLGSLKTGTLPPLRLDLLSGELKHVNLNSGMAATIFEALAAANTKVTRTILVEADKIADELSLDDALLDSILVDLGLE